MEDRYLLHNVESGRGWSSKAEQRKELRRLKKLVRGRLERLEKYAEKDDFYKTELKNRMKEAPFRDIIKNPSDYSLEEQLAAFARVADTNISVTGFREQLKQEQMYASEVAAYYENKFDEIGFREFMGAIRYSGMMFRIGSEAAVRAYETIEEKKLNPIRVLQNFERYRKQYDF